MSLPSYYSIYDSFVLDTTGNIGIGTAYPKSVIDITNRKDAIIIPSKDVDNTPEPVPETPNVNANKVGVLRMNKSYGRFEKKSGTNWTQTSIWQPVIVSANPTKLQNAGMQTTVNGVLFEINSVWSFVGSDGTNYPCVSQFVNPSQVILTRPDVFPVSKSPYRIRVYNGEAAREYISSTLLIDAGVGPTFTTPAGSLSILLPNSSNSMVISATDELYGGISNISIDNALMGSGLSATFSNNSLTFSGTTSDTQSVLTYNFLSTAIDLGGNTSTRSFSFSISPLQLYDFTSHEFTSAGQTSRTGPTLAQCRSTYSSVTWAQNTTNNYLSMDTQGIQKWIIPKTGTYSFTVAGAQGGTATSNGYAGGKGRIVYGTATLFANDVLYIIVGQPGSNSQYQPAGGGGSFVFLNSISSSTYILIAGGGGGSTHTNLGSDGSTGTSGLNGNSNKAGNGGGGANGLGGGGGSRNIYASNASQNGENGSNGVGGNGGNDNQGGGGGGGGIGNSTSSFMGGSVGGGSGWSISGANGGFGGGGGSGNGGGGGGGAGGGGGYSGGGGGVGDGGSTSGGGGGGGSIANVFVTNYNNNFGTKTGSGYVKIQI